MLSEREELLAALGIALERTDQIEAEVPGLAGRVDRSRIAAAGHSLGGHTVGLLLGMQMLDPSDARKKDLADPRIRAGILMAAPGIADDHFAAWAAEHYPALKYVNFEQMKGAALVVAGDKDLNPYFSDRLSYRWDAYTHSPAGNKTLLTLLGGAEHMLGGISGYDCKETTDENPARVAALRALVCAYLRSQLYPGDRSWNDAVALLQKSEAPIARVESR